MKIQKLAIILLIGMGCLLGTPKIVTADDKMSEQQCAVSEIGDYLAGWGYDNKDNVQISQQYEINDTKNDSYLYFIKVNGKQVGAINVSKVNDKNRTAFLYSKEAFKELEKDEKVAVSSNGKGITLSTEGETKVLTGEASSKNCSRHKLKAIKYKDVTKSISVHKYKVVNNIGQNSQNNGLVPCQDYQQGFSYIGTHQKSYKTIINTKNTLLKFTTQLGFVPNASVNNEGLCWAATGASIINYKRGGTTKCTALGIYNELKKKYGGIPLGTHEWEERMWKYYAISMKRVDHKLSFTSVVNLMEAHKPIYCCFLHYENKSTDYAHAVALCGCYYRTDLKRYYYVYMDPNWPGDKVYVVNHIFEAELNGSTGYKFYYNPGGDTGIYNNWTYAYY